MVNVPGRSKACHNCRRRRIACDQQRPGCGRCQKASLTCEGYERDRVWVNVTAADSRRSKQAADQKAAKIGPIPPFSEKTVVHPSSNRRKNASFGHKNGHFYPSTTPSPGASEVPPWAAFRAALLASFVTPERDWWLAPVHELSSLPPALENGVLAVCTANLARATGDPALKAASLQMYGRGLGEMSNALQDPVAVHSDETLAACVTLAVYELIECPSGRRDAYMNHREGCSKLVKYRGIDRCRTGWGRKLFGVVRFQSVVASLGEKRESFVMEEPWRSIQATQGPLGHLERLTVFMGTIPRILAKSDGLLDEGLDNAQRFKEMDELLSHLWELNNIMEDHWEELRAERGEKPLFWYRKRCIDEFTEVKEENGDLNADKDSSIIEFPDMVTADVVVLMWALEAMLWAGMTVIYFVLPPTALMAGRLDFSMDKSYPPLGHRQNWIERVHKVCASVGYCTSAWQSLTGPRISAALGLLRGMLKYHPHHHEALRKVQEAYDQVGRTKMKFLQTFEAQ